MEISWPDYAIANSNKKYQLIIGMYYGDNWDSSNDPSRKGIKDIGPEYDDIVGGVDLAEKCEYVCVYADGVLVGGTEPDGTQPEKVYKGTQAVRLVQHLTGKRELKDDVKMMFDFNGDKIVNVTDLILLKNLIPGK